jgi:hypothetical protein
MKRTDRKNKVGQQRYEVRKLRDPGCRGKFRIQLRNRFTALEGMEDEESVETVERIEVCFQCVCRSYIRRE